MVIEIESIAALNAEELAIDAGAIAIVTAQNLIVARAQSRLAAIRAMRADGADMLHLPRPCLVSIDAAGQRAHRADIDTHAAFVAVEMVAFIRRNLGNRTTIHHAQRAHTHAFIANAHAAETEDATRAIVKHHRRPLLLIDVPLVLDEAAFARAVAEHHVLQFALAALIANRAIERMVGQQELERHLARLTHLLGIGADHHALGHRRGAGGRHLGSFFHFHQAHAASRLQRIAVVIAESRNLNAGLLGRIDQ